MFLSQTQQNGVWTSHPWRAQHKDGWGHTPAYASRDLKAPAQVSSCFYYVHLIPVCFCFEMSGICINFGGTSSRVNIGLAFYNLHFIPYDFFLFRNTQKLYFLKCISEYIHKCIFPQKIFHLLFYIFVKIYWKNIFLKNLTIYFALQILFTSTLKWDWKKDFIPYG